MQVIRHFSLFSGVESFKKALDNIGVDNELVGYSEIDKYASEALAAIHGVSTELNLGDISEIDEAEVPNCDLITYGFPCQDISIAGLQKGIVEGETRSGLLYEAERIIDHIKPKYAIAENVKNLIGKRHKEDFDRLLERLERYGYNNYWDVLNAKDYGVPQNRERVFIVSIRKDIDDGGFQFPKAKELKVRLKDILDKEYEDKYIVDNERTEKILSSNFNQEKGLIQDSDGICNTLLARDYKDPKCVRLTGLYDVKGKKRQAGAVWDKDGLSPTIDTMQGGHREPLIIVKEGTKKGYNIAREGDSINLAFPSSTTRRGRIGKGVAQTLDTSCSQYTLQNYKIRKLTPLECWRLMGFSDTDYWAARTRLEEVFYRGADRSNSQMYKMAGNSIVVDVLEGIFKNLFNV